MVKNFSVRGSGTEVAAVVQRAARAVADTLSAVAKCGSVFTESKESPKGD